MIRWDDLGPRRPGLLLATSGGLAVNSLRGHAIQPPRRIAVNSRGLPRESWQSLLSRPTVFVHHQLPTALEVPAVLVVSAPACELLRLVSGRNSHEHAGTPVPQRRERNLSVRLSQLLGRPNHHLGAWH